MGWGGQDRDRTAWGQLHKPHPDPLPDPSPLHPTYPVPRLPSPALHPPLDLRPEPRSSSGHLRNPSQTDSRSHRKFVFRLRLRRAAAMCVCGGGACVYVYVCSPSLTACAQTCALNTQFLSDLCPSDVQRDTPRQEPLYLDTTDHFLQSSLHTWTPLTRSQGHTY